MLARFTRTTLAIALLAGAAAGQTELSPAQSVEPRLGLSPEQSIELLDSMAPSNAALVYYQLFLQLSPDFEKASMFFGGDQTDEGLIAEQKASGMTREDAARALESNQGFIGQYVWASKLPLCDFGVMYQNGWGALLPHLGKMRASARGVRADAWRKFESGDPALADEAAAQLAAIYNTGRQVSRDRLLISSLVGIALTTYAHDLTLKAIDEGWLTNEGRDTLIAALERFEGDDPFRTRECVRMEGAVTVGWIAREFGDLPDGGRRLVEFGIAGDSAGEGIAKVRRMDGRALVAEMSKLTPFYEQTLECWNDEDAGERMEALGTMASVGAFGDLAALMVPSMGTARERDLSAQRKIAETLDALRAYRAPEADEAAPAGVSRK